MCQPIQFILHQLATKEQDRGRFNQVIGIYFEGTKTPTLLRAMPRTNGVIGFVQKSEVGYYLEDFSELDKIYQITIIRTCLSRINDEAVLGVFEGYFGYYKAFDYQLRNGHPLNTALSALHEKMLELVPEYQEFLKNNK